MNNQNESHSTTPFFFIILSAIAGSLLTIGSIYFTQAYLSPVGVNLEQNTNEDTHTHEENTEANDDHSHETVYEVPENEPVPSIAMTITPDTTNTSFNVQLETTNFTFTPENVNGDHEAGEGHAHLYVDGVKIARMYSPWFHIGELETGTHTITATLNTNDHQVYSSSGSEISTTQTITVHK